VRIVIFKYVATDLPISIFKLFMTSRSKLMIKCLDDIISMKETLQARGSAALY